MEKRLGFIKQQIEINEDAMDYLMEDFRIWNDAMTAEIEVGNIGEIEYRNFFNKNEKQMLERYTKLSDQNTDYRHQIKEIQAEQATYI